MVLILSQEEILEIVLEHLRNDYSIVEGKIQMTDHDGGFEIAATLIKEN